MFWRHVVSMFYQNCRYDGSQASSSISSKVDEALQDPENYRNVYNLLLILHRESTQSVTMQVT